MSYFSYYKPYVPVAKRRAQAAQTIQKMMKGGRKPQPVEITGRKIAETFWGNAWCDNLERYSDYANRLPRGKTYARNGSVIHLEIQSGKIAAMVQGSELYQVEVTIAPLEKTRWSKLKQESTGKITNLLDLIQGKLPKELLVAITAQATGIFPNPKEIKLSCSCPDGAYMCKHVAAVLYGVGNRLDRSPELFFTLRSLDMKELLASAGTRTTQLTGTASELGSDDLSDIFGIEIEGPATAPPTRARANSVALKKKSAPAPAAAPAKKAGRAAKKAVVAAKPTKRAPLKASAQTTKSVKSVKKATPAKKVPASKVTGAKRGRR